MVEPKNNLSQKELLDEAWNENLKYSGKLIRMTKSRQDHIRTQLIHLLEKKKPTKFEIDLAQIWLKAYDKTQKFTKKALADSVKRLDYLTVLYKQEAEASKIRMAKKTAAEKKAPTYNISFRVLTEVSKDEARLMGEKGKSTRTITVGGIKYSQVGKSYAFQTKINIS